jgi:hypothetical protein
LGRSGQPLTVALEQASTFILTLRKPQVNQAALKRIKQGDYYQFDWQRSQASL